MEPVRTGAKNATVELLRNPEQLLGEIAPRVGPEGCKLGIGSAEHRTPLLDDIQPNERCRCRMVYETLL